MTSSALTIKALALAVFAGTIAVAWGLTGFAIGRQFQDNTLCCAVPPYRNVALSLRQLLGLVQFHSQIGQDIWTLETALPGVRNGYFLDVGSGDGIVASNTKALEERGWKGICVDPFPTHMESRTCRLFKEVVYGEAGKRLTFHTAGELGGLANTLGEWKAYAEKAPTVEFTTVTLGDILARAKAPPRIDFVSLDIEGAELEALKGFPFDRYSIGALAVEHNFEEPKRSQIQELLNNHGYTRAHTWYQDDFYVPGAATNAPQTTQATNAIDNARVMVRDMTASPHQPIRISDERDAVVVSLAPGRTGDVAFEKRGASLNVDRVIAIELKEDSKAARQPPYPNTSGYPNAFPRPGSRKVLDNDRVVVWDYTWKTGVPTPIHFHDRDVVVVYLAEGALTSTTPDGAKTVNEHHFGLTKFNPGNRVHTETLTSGDARAIIVELK